MYQIFNYISHKKISIKVVPSLCINFASMILFNTYTYLQFKFAPNIPVHTKLSILYICKLLFLLSVSCHSVTLWSFCHYNTFLVCANTPGNKALSDCVSSIFTSEEPFLIPCSLWTQPWKIDVFSYCQLRHPTVIVSLNSCGRNLDILLCLLMQLQLKKNAALYHTC